MQHLPPHFLVFLALRAALASPRLILHTRPRGCNLRATIANRILHNLSYLFSNVRSDRVNNSLEYLLHNPSTHSQVHSSTNESPPPAVNILAMTILYSLRSLFLMLTLASATAT